MLLEDLHREADRPDLAQATLKLAEAAHAEPKLRQLYPVTSHEADSAEEAIALVVGGMPAACGPAVAGTAGDQRNG